MTAIYWRINLLVLTTISRNLKGSSEIISTHCAFSDQHAAVALLLLADKASSNNNKNCVAGVLHCVSTFSLDQGSLLKRSHKFFLASARNSQQLQIATETRIRVILYYWRMKMDYFKCFTNQWCEVRGGSIFEFWLILRQI